VKILVDMNLSPLWVEPLSRGGFAAVHWSKVGDPRAPDRTLMQWAREHGYVVFTHDLDFGTLLTLTREVGPSVVQVRTPDVSPEHLWPVISITLRDHADALDAGALVTVDEARSHRPPLPQTGRAPASSRSRRSRVHSPGRPWSSSLLPLALERPVAPPRARDLPAESHSSGAGHRDRGSPFAQRAVNRAW
jgi:predicted nuclease of predicted toxin-antitoxin system